MMILGCAVREMRLIRCLIMHQTNYKLSRRYVLIVPDIILNTSIGNGLTDGYVTVCFSPSLPPKYIHCLWQTLPFWHFLMEEMVCSILASEVFNVLAVSSCCKTFRDIVLQTSRKWNWLILWYTYNKSLFLNQNHTLVCLDVTAWPADLNWHLNAWQCIKNADRWENLFYLSRISSVWMYVFSCFVLFIFLLSSCPFFISEFWVGSYKKMVSIFSAVNITTFYWPKHETKKKIIQCGLTTITIHEWSNLSFFPFPVIGNIC